MVSIFRILIGFTYFSLLLMCCISCNKPAPDSRNEASKTEIIDYNPMPDARTATDSNMEEAPGQTTGDLGSKIVNYAGTLTDIPYKEAGRDTSGFDCSGFVYYVFKNFNIDIPHSSRHLAQMGTQIEVKEAQKGDLIFFRGTNAASTEVGHVGIVVSGTGEKIKFIHSSSTVSSPCVRVDSLEKPNYERRFLMIKRIL